MRCGTLCISIKVSNVEADMACAQLHVVSYMYWLSKCAVVFRFKYFLFKTMTAKKLDEIFGKISEIQEEIREIKCVLVKIQAEKESTPSIENDSAINFPMTTSQQLDTLEKVLEKDDDFYGYFDRFNKEMNSIPVSTLFNRRKCLKERLFSKYVYIFCSDLLSFALHEYSQSVLLIFFTVSY